MNALRDYQLECADAIDAALAKHQSTMAVLATALGKTVIFAETIRRRQPGRAMVIAGQDNLLFQAQRVIKEWTGLSCALEMNIMVAPTHEVTRPQVVLATWQTLISGGKKRDPLFGTPSSLRLHRFKPEDFDLIVIDEFHHAAAKSYRVILDWFKRNPNIKILGVTATPRRGDGLALRQICESHCYDYPIQKGVENGWLVEVVQHFCPVGSLDYSHIKTTAGELNGAQLAQVMEAEENIAGVCHPTLEVMFGLEPHTLDSVSVPEWGKYLLATGRTPRRTILFTCTVLQAELSCNIFNRVIPGLADWVCGATAKDKRADTFKRFGDGTTALLANVGVTVEGYDNPFVEVIGMARPTLSVSAYLQQLGRGTRLLPGLVNGIQDKDARRALIAASAKPRVRIIDYVGNTGRHKIVNSYDALGGRMSEDAIKKAIATQIRDGKPKNVIKAMTNAEKEVEQERRDAAEKSRLEEEARRASLVPYSKFGWREVNGFDTHKERLPMPGRGGNGKLLSEKQQKVLRRAGFPPERLTYGQGRHVIGLLVQNKWQLTPELRKWRDGLRNPAPTADGWEKERWVA